MTEKNLNPPLRLEIEWKSEVIQEFHTLSGNLGSNFPRKILDFVSQIFTYMAYNLLVINQIFTSEKN